MEEIAPDAIAPHDGKNILDEPLKHLDTVIALYDFPGTQTSYLPLNLGDTVYVLSKSETGWWDGVVICPNNELLRGWFPHNYVRSINYVQPVLNKLKSNREIDSITAANTAANVLIPLFTNLLQKNLVDSEKNSPANSTRKNSLVSFASSETSIPSDSKSHAAHISSMNSTLSAPNQASISHALSTDDLFLNIQFLSLEDAEQAAEDYKKTHKQNIVWLPRCTTGGDVVFYCDKLDIYCESMPLVTFDAEFEIDAKFALPSRNAFYDTSLVKYESEYPIMNDVNKNMLGESRNPSSSSKDFNSLKRDSSGSMSSQSTNTSQYHNFSQPFFAVDGLFYNHPTDIAHWSELKQQFNYLLHLSHKAIKNSDKHLFSAHFSRVNKLISAMASISRLISNDYVKTKYEDSIKRKLKRIVNSYSQIYINGILHLSMMHYAQDSTSTKVFNIDVSRIAKNDAPVSFDKQCTQLDESVDLSQGTVNEDGTFVSYLQQIEFEMNNLKQDMNAVMNIFIALGKNKKIKNSDYDLSDASDDEGEDRYNILPQVYPRFIAEEFNGGNWCNPFFASKNPVLNASGDGLKNRYHLKIIIDREAYDSIRTFSEEMIKLSEETLEYIDPKVQHLYYNIILKNERNTQILRLIYKYLYHASMLIDIMESFDFTIFCLIQRFSSAEGNPDKILNELRNKSEERPTYESTSNLTFDYPIVLEFFLLKQQFHDLIARIVMATQSLTLEDPDVFKGIRNDDPLIYNRDILKIPTEKAAMLLTNLLVEQSNQVNGKSISKNCDTLMYSYLLDGIKFLDSVLPVIQLLIDERENVLNYATRVMHDDLNVQLLLMERNNTVLSEKSDEGHSYYTGKKQSNDIPWYLEGDDEYDLLLDIKGNIKGGTKEALISHLTHHDYFDSNFNTAFLLTFATMLSIGELIELLIDRFNFEAPEGLSYEEYNAWISKKQNPIRLRVMNVMKLLMEKHWADSYYNEDVIKHWLTFVQSPQVRAFSVGKVLEGDLLTLLNHEVVCHEKRPSLPTTKPPAPLLKGSSMKKIKLLDIDYIELARQLTIKEFKLYSKITKFECLTKVWGKKSGLNENIDSITNFIRTSNQLTNYVAYMILRKQEVKKRVQLIRYFIQVAEKCKQYNNFSSMTAIISALYSSPIHRLSKTWKHVSPEILANLQSMNKLMNSSRNFNEYRDVLRFVGSEPCVPFFGVYLSDLTFVYHGNPDYLMNRTKMINFAKRSKTCEIVMGIDRFKSTAYNLLEVNDIQIYLDSWLDKCPTIEEQYQLSLNLEPRENSVHHSDHARGQKPSSSTFSFNKN